MSNIYSNLMQNENYNEVFTLHVINSIGDKIILASNIEDDVTFYYADEELFNEYRWTGPDLVGKVVIIRGAFEQGELTNLWDLRVFAEYA